MNFRSLNIEVEQWGDKKGQVTAKLRVEGKSVDTTITLPHEATERIVQCCAEELADAAQKQAAEFRTELLAAIGSLKKIGV